MVILFRVFTFVRSSGDIPRFEAVKQQLGIEANYIDTEFQSRLEGYENVRAQCRNCGNWDAHCETRWPFFTVCFVPLIPLSTHKYKEVRCYRCGFSQDLSMRPDINPGTQPPPGMPWGPAYGPPQPPQYAYQPQQHPPAGYPSGPPVASGGNQDAGHTTFKYNKMSRHHCRDFICLPSPSPSPYHIFFLPGNPGLVEYYARFLLLLHSTLNHASSIQFNIAGCSYAGFETEHSSLEYDNGGHKLYDIAEQVDYSLERLQDYINQTEEKQTKAKVILIGHSFGTFVIAEMMKRIYTSSTKDQQQNYEIIGNIHLFPPIPDIARSPRGVKAAGIVKWRYLPGIISYIAKAVYNLPYSLSNAVVRYLTAFPSDSEALHTTRMFFGSRNGVAQALYLAQHEFDEIKTSRWEAALRAIASHHQQENQQGKFPIRIFFGVNDHWVNNELRDAFIYKYCDPNGPLAFGKEVLDLRARIDPSVDGDESSVVIPHDFSIGHSEHVVPYAAEYVEEIIGIKV
ncbi:conserved hypothetical protein [Talaromyces stipitatus ATCC 10500]|uniref:Lipid droplet-associated hydrolase n=1 Tax=Talaromyces stipitatus (strain ATCC 10500 / CBS 375.48 / QM 6759 / NRRL 1006) TaxID=441959 RepID=B8MH07_TALSN|nr:uncharacterized protein TSTA_018870 [Talaromyces stipitatus ATCC 10500]EED16821.1 conserved hypothetical protein [Talaromyces stipitatus ATCC 10500]